MTKVRSEIRSEIGLFRLIPENGILRKHALFYKDVPIFFSHSAVLIRFHARFSTRVGRDFGRRTASNYIGEGKQNECHQKSDTTISIH